LEVADSVDTEGILRRFNHEAAMTVIVFSTYSKIFDLWANSAIRRDTTTEDYQKIFASFAEFVNGKEIASVSRLDVLGFRDHLAAQGQSPATVTRKIGILKTLFRVAREYELISSNPADQVRVTYIARQKSRVAFSLGDLARIFNSPIYTDDYRPVAGGKDACYWLPLLALFTGARVEELAQLLVNDVRSADGLGWYLNISDEAAHSQLKNAASRRCIPLHRTLIDCGFLDYVQTMRDSPLLFPALKPNPRKKLGGYFSTFFSVYLRKRLRITDKRKVFHSFRHTFKDICRRAGIDEAVHDALTGHTAPHAGRRYGNELYPLEPLFEAIDQVEVQGLDLSHLYIHQPNERVPKPESRMISAYYGIIVAFCQARSSAPTPPCIHARCQGAEASFSITDNALVCGTLPSGKQFLVQAWIEIHREELTANWENWRVSGDVFRIDPLR
jgi:integrase